MESKGETFISHHLLETLGGIWNQQTVGAADGSIVYHHTPNFCFHSPLFTRFYYLLIIVGIINDYVKFIIQYSLLVIEKYFYNTQDYSWFINQITSKYDMQVPGNLKIIQSYSCQSS